MMYSLEERRRIAEIKVQSMIKLAPKKPNEGGDNKEKRDDGSGDQEQFETSDKQHENLAIRPSSFGLRALYSRVDINNDKWLLTIDENARKKLEEPPSLADGLSREIESELRYLGCELIQQGSIMLKLPQTAAATGQILYQRFYYQRSFVKYFFEHAVMACLMLASKIEEEPRRARDVYNVFMVLEKIHRLQERGIPITKETTANFKPPALDASYARAKNNIILMERRILSTLGFVVHVKHPHRLIVAYCHILGLSNTRRDILQKAWNYMNDGLRTDMFLRYTPETIACACIFLAARTVDDPVPLPTTPFQWFEAFDTSDRDVKSISLQLLKLYTRKRIPNWPRINAELDKLRDAIEAEKRAAKAKEIAERLAMEEKISAENAANERQNGKRNGKEITPEVRDRDRDHHRRKISRSRDRDRERKPRSDKHSPRRRKSLERDRERPRKDDKDKRDKDRKRRSRSRDRDIRMKEKSKAREREVMVSLGKRYRREGSLSSPVKIRR